MTTIQTYPMRHVWGLRWGRADGSWLTADGMLTEDVRDARLFPTRDRAETFVRRTLVADLAPDGPWHVAEIDLAGRT